MGNQENKMATDIFPEKLREIMELKGWSQKTLEGVSGISQGTISNYLRGKREPTAYQLRILAHSLGVRMEWLLAGQGFRSIEDHLESMESGVGATTSSDDSRAFRYAAEEVDAVLTTELIRERAIAAESKLGKTRKRLKILEGKLRQVLDEVEDLENGLK